MLWPKTFAVFYLAFAFWLTFFWDGQSIQSHHTLTVPTEFMLQHFQTQHLALTYRKNIHNWQKARFGDLAKPFSMSEHLFSVNSIEHLHFTLHHYNPSTSSSLPGQISVPREFGVPSQSHGLLPSCAVAFGCQQAGAVDTDGSIALW